MLVQVHRFLSLTIAGCAGHGSRYYLLVKLSLKKAPLLSKSTTGRFGQPGSTILAPTNSGFKRQGSTSDVFFGRIYCHHLDGEYLHGLLNLARIDSVVKAMNFISVFAKAFCSSRTSGLYPLSCSNLTHFRLLHRKVSLLGATDSTMAGSGCKTRTLPLPIRKLEVLFQALFCDISPATAAPLCCIGFAPLQLHWIRPHPVGTRHDDTIKLF
jgi:hypothetical protein